MAQATYSVRIDEEKKAEFDKICERLGLSPSAAISTFVHRTVEERGLPYPLKLQPTPSDYGILEADKMSREELLDEVQKGIDEVEAGEWHTPEEVFSTIMKGAYARV